MFNNYNKNIYNQNFLLLINKTFLPPNSSEIRDFADLFLRFVFKYLSNIIMSFGA